MAENVTAPESPAWLECACAGRLFALPLTHVVEMMRPQPVVPVSGAPSFVLGLSIIRGAAVPVISASLLLGAPGGAATRFVTIQVGGRHAALAVGNVLGLRAAAPHIAALPPLLDGVASDVLSSIAARDIEFLFFLDLARLVSLTSPLAPGSS